MASVEQDCDTPDEQEEEKLKPKEVQMSSSGVCVNMNAQTGGTVNAPVLTGNTIKSLTINYSAAEPRNPSETTEKHTEKQADLTLKDFLETHKPNMKKKAEHVFECKKENEAHLQDVYTELFITEGDMKEVNQEREILKIDDAFSKNKQTQDKQIKCNDIFTLLKEKKQSTLKIVLTKGVAGIGKTVSVHKFILDWAEGEANQDIHCVFLLPFRDLNSMTDEDFSLHELLLEFYPELEGLEKTKLYKECNLVFIFDGLDESRLPLNFKSRTSPRAIVEKRSSVDGLFTGLVKGELLPSALVWVTSRPAAANQIPPEHVGLFTEVRGFNDQQKEQYFRKRITDKALADRIIKHIKMNRSLYIMCHIPVFCWITATVLQDILTETNAENISTTLTEMYIHFLLIQMNMKSQKYDEQEEREYAKNLDSNRTMLLKLAKLAFEQLKKENIVFYEEDLKACSIDVSKDTEFTGMIAEIFKKEKGLHEKKVFSFMHLSVQEFLAAVHVFLCYLDKNMQELQFFFDEPEENITLKELLEKVIDKAMQSKKGHLDMFLRFLMGISLETSQNSLKGLFKHTEDTTECIRQISEHIKQLSKRAHISPFPRTHIISALRKKKRTEQKTIKNKEEEERHKTQKKHTKTQNISDEAKINLFYCLLELKDHSFFEEIQKYLSSDEHPGRGLSSSMCTVLTYVLLMSEKVLNEFNPKRFTSSQENYERLIPAVRCCRKAQLSGCMGDINMVFSALQLSNSLRELDLSNNRLNDWEVEKLSDGLRSTHCQLNILRLCMCHLSDQSCQSLSSVLQSKNSALRELDLSNNDLQNSGVKLLSEGLMSSHCQLNILRLSGCMVTEEGCGYLSSALNSNPLHLRELDLSYNHPGDAGVNLLSDKVKDPDCTLEKLNVDHGGEFRIMHGLYKYACDLTLDPNTANNDLFLFENNRHVSSVPENVRSLVKRNEKFWSSVLNSSNSVDHGGQFSNTEGLHKKNMKIGLWSNGRRPGGLMSPDSPCYRVMGASRVDHGREFRIIEGLYKYACDFTLDPNTADNEVTLSEENEQPYPDHPERFDYVVQEQLRRDLIQEEQQRRGLIQEEQQR
ncbi:hypothetical protein QQF64_020091 [Cirrhinus molitorella]|uniref:NACHT domain-containing protein n=1 Tax=Cirrhinus molitorella TaxID=172907 RepID=A0ABR3LJ03_9TELE